MPKFEENFGNYFKLPNPGLRSYFGRVVAGQPDVYRTPFYKKKSVDAILDNWGKKLKAIDKRWESLLTYEYDQRAKVGPMSVMKPLSERMGDIDAYYDSVLPESAPILSKAIDLVVQDLSGIKGLRMKSESQTVMDMKKSTNSGSPFFAKRKLVLKDTVPCDIWKYGSTIGQDLPHSSWFGCAVLGWRGQEGGPREDDVKQRVVWMFPFAVNVQELRVYQPLIKAVQRDPKSIVPAWISMDAVDERITRMFDTKAASDVVVCTDFSKFDQHFNSNLQEAAKTILKQLFDNTDADFVDWLDSVYPVKYMIPLAYDYGKIRKGKHGMASGSGGTNADETLAHRALQHEAALRSGATLNPFSQCLGDDGILTYPGITVEDVMSTYTSHGLEMNPDKQYVSKQDCVYLRRWHHTDYRVEGRCAGVYPTMRALGRLIYQERYYDPEDWSAEMVALRELSIINNCEYHPLRDEFAEYCMKGDKYKLGLLIPGFLANIQSIAEKAIDIMPDFLGYTRSLQQDGRPDVSGIGEWWIVKYLKSKL